MKTILISFLIFFGVSGTSHAYLDPGTGSVILQFLIAALAAGAAGVTIFWRKVKDFFLRRILRREIKQSVQQARKENPNK